VQSQNLGLDWDERVLPSIGTEIVKAIVAQYNAEHLITKREQVSKDVTPISAFLDQHEALFLDPSELECPSP